MDLKPTSEAELSELIAGAAAAGQTLEIRGGGSKAGVGRSAAATVLGMGGFSGVVDYDPAELVLTVRAGTSLDEVRALVAGQSQMLAFEPFDHGPLFGERGGRATIGGIVAAAVAGPRRLSRGGARDHLLGFRAVSGRGEGFVAGGKVVKNVTGYDLPKLAAGSWGRLMALTEVTLKVLPAPRTTATLVLHGLAPDHAYAAMSKALGSQAEVAAAAHIPAAPITLFRLEGFEPSVQARAKLLQDLIGAEPLDAEDIWREVVELPSLAGADQLWRMVIPARRMAELTKALDDLGASWLADWGGGLVWAGHSGAPLAIREAASAVGGHAMLVRAPGEVRADVPAFHPPAPGVAALEERVRRAFDPAGVFETGRF